MPLNGGEHSKRRTYEGWWNKDEGGDIWGWCVGRNKEHEENEGYMVRERGRKGCIGGGENK